MLDNYAVAVILAGGSGSRMKSDKTKQMIEILGETVLHRSVRAFDEASTVDEIVVVARAEERDEIEAMLSDIKKPFTVTVGGATRSASARRGFEAISPAARLVAVHDAARCLVTPETVNATVRAAAEFGAAACCSSVVDTVKLSEDGFIVGTVDRAKLRIAQTPQVFSVELYKKALDEFGEDVDITDDNMMVERLGERIFCVNSSSQNMKITTADDLALAEFILEKRGKNV